MISMVGYPSEMSDLVHERSPPTVDQMAKVPAHQEIPPFGVSGVHDGLKHPQEVLAVAGMAIVSVG